MIRETARRVVWAALLAFVTSLCAGCWEADENDDPSSGGDGGTGDTSCSDPSDVGDTEPDGTDPAEPDTESDVDTDTGLPTEGSAWCWLVAPRSDGKLAVIQVDIDTGTWFEYGAYGDGVESSLHTAGMARVGDALVMAAYTGNEFHWVEVDMAAGTVTEGENSGYAVAVGSDGTRLVTLCDDYGGFCFYDDFEALNAGIASEIVPSDAYASRLCATPELVYTAWHSTDEVDVFDRDTGAQVSTIALEEWDGWVWGMSVAGGRLHLADMGGPIAQFWPETGALLGAAAVGWDTDVYTHPASGLWCEPY